MFSGSRDPDRIFSEALQAGELDPLTSLNRQQQLEMFLNQVADGNPLDGEGCGNLWLMAKGANLSFVDLQLWKRSSALEVRVREGLRLPIGNCKQTKYHHHHLPPPRKVL